MLTKESSPFLFLSKTFLFHSCTRNMIYKWKTPYKSHFSTEMRFSCVSLLFLLWPLHTSRRKKYDGMSINIKSTIQTNDYSMHNVSKITCTCKIGCCISHAHSYSYLEACLHLALWLETLCMRGTVRESCHYSKVDDTDA